MSTQPEIDPRRLYSFAEAARLVPSPLAGRAGVCLDTLHAWRKAGRFRAEARQVNSGRRWFVFGSELLRLLPAPPPPPEPRPPTEAQRRSGHERAMATLRAMGLCEG